MLLIALGGNMTGPQGTVVDTLRWALREIDTHIGEIQHVSAFYRSAALEGRGPGDNDYVNAVASARTGLPPLAALKRLQAIERKAGRKPQELRLTGRWQSRPLDLDIIDFGGMIRGWKGEAQNLCRREAASQRLAPAGTGPENRLILPHPAAHLRPFVLRPIIDIAPFWHHPVCRLSALALLHRQSFFKHGQVLEKLASFPLTG